MLYKREELYRTVGDTASDIKLKRNDAYTKGIVQSMKCRMVKTEQTVTAKTAMLLQI